MSLTTAIASTVWSVRILHTNLLALYDQASLDCRMQLGVARVYVVPFVDERFPLLLQILHRHFSRLHLATREMY